MSRIFLFAAFVFVFLASSAGEVDDAVSTDMSAFAKRGGRLIAYAGKIDPCIPWEPLVDWHMKAKKVLDVWFCPLAQKKGRW